MNWQILIAMIVAIPVILLPIAGLWYLDVGGLFTGIKKKMAHRDKTKKENIKPD